MSKVAVRVFCASVDVESYQYLVNFGVHLAWGKTPNEAVEALRDEAAKSLRRNARSVLEAGTMGDAPWYETSGTVFSTRIAFGQHPEYGPGWCAYGTLIAASPAIKPNRRDSIPDDVVEIKHAR